MKKRILNELLDRYERSKAFREGASARRVLVDVSSCPQFSSCMEQGDSRREFLEELESLRQEGLLDYTWVRFERGNLVDKVWWLGLIAEAAEHGQVRICHWSDIDLGGFRIFLRLKKEISFILNPSPLRQKAGA